METLYKKLITALDFHNICSILKRNQVETKFGRRRLSLDSIENRLYKIGEISQYFHLSEQTLRLYAKNGLFVPDVVNEATGYRYYRNNQFERLRLILFLKDLGLPLKTIKHLVDMPKGEEYIQILINYREGLNQQIRRDVAKKKFLDEKIKNLLITSKLPQNKVLLQRFPKQRIVRYDKSIVGGAAHEQALLEFMSSCQLSPALGRIGQMFDPLHLIENDELAAKSMFVREEVCTLIPDDKTDVIHHDVLPAGIYATMYYQRRTEDSIPFVFELLDEVKRRSFSPLGEVIRTITFDVGSCEYNESGYLACIRVLVQQT